MKNVIDYIGEYGKYTFSEEPLNEVDSLVLCQLVYLNFEGFVPGMANNPHPVSIQSIYRHPERDRILEGYWYREDNKALFEAMALSVRFGSLKMNDYVNIINEKDETQFSAMTYILDDKTAYIAYRGTDANIIGWKEDLNLAFSKPLHSQLLGVEYMNRVAGQIGGGFYAGGHSKGGNLAVYAAMNCEERVRRRLLWLFNNDGPGFRPELISKDVYPEIEKRMSKFIPKSSVVGMLLETGGSYEVVESKSVGMLQHNAYNWKVEGKSFVRAGSIRNGRAMMDSAINEWILSLSEEDAHAFVDTLYEIVSASEAKNLFEMGADFRKCLQSMSEAFQELDEETAGMMRRIFRSLLEITGEKAFLGMKEKSRLRKRPEKRIRRK